MTHDTLQTILSIGETVSVEFKRGGNGAEADTFESIYAFLNRFGGDVFLGVRDDGTVVGVPPAAAPQIANHIVNVAGDPGVFQPASEIIAAFFREIGLADQLGSGVRNLYKYARAYGGADPEIVENDTFRISVNIPDEASEQLVLSDQKLVSDGEKLVSTSKKLVFDGKKLVFDGRTLQTPHLSRPTLEKISVLYSAGMDTFGIQETAALFHTSRSGAIRLLRLLREAGLIMLAPSSKRGKYRFVLD